MNAYLVIELGDHLVWIAPTMQRALDLTWHRYVKDNGFSVADGLDEEREEYEHDCLESCSLLGEVANP